MLLLSEAKNLLTQIKPGSIILLLSEAKHLLTRLSP